MADRPLNFSEAKETSNHATWFDLEPGDGTRYYFGVTEVPFFVPGCSGAKYIQIIHSRGCYQFRLDEILHDHEHEAHYGYYADKLHIDEWSAKVIVKFLNYYLRKGE